MLWRPFRRLQWRLTLSYVMVTVLGVVTIEIIGLVILGYTIWRPIQSQLLQYVSVHASNIAPYLESEPIGRESLSALLDAHAAQVGPDSDADRQSVAISFHMNEDLAFVVIDANGRVIATSRHSVWRSGPTLAKNLSHSEIMSFERVLRGGSANATTLTTQGNRIIFASAPIIGKNGRVIGALVSRLSVPYSAGRLLRAEMHLLLPTASAVALLAAVLGIGFGYFTARRLTSRISKISTAADAWSRGGFSESASDNTNDELGHLSRRLDQMAIQLREHLDIRENLATTEERNRLARDLHDTVKQETFAAAMHIGAAQSLFDKDLPAARTHLDETSKLVHRIQQNLTAIIQELMPSTEPMEASEEAIRKYTSEWSRQNGVALSLSMDIPISLPRNVEEAFLRIVQGALSNIARHSRAANVLVELEQSENHRIVLSITDDGNGFDTATVDGGIGLRIMRERAEALRDGTFKIESNPGAGTRLEVNCAIMGEDK